MTAQSQASYDPADWRQARQDKAMQIQARCKRAIQAWGEHDKRGTRTLGQQKTTAQDIVEAMYHGDPDGDLAKAARAVADAERRLGIAQSGGKLR